MVCVAVFFCGYFAENDLFVILNLNLVSFYVGLCILSTLNVVVLICCLLCVCADHTSFCVLPFDLLGIFGVWVYRFEFYFVCKFYVVFILIVGLFIFALLKLLHLWLLVLIVVFVFEFGFGYDVLVLLYWSGFDLISYCFYCVLTMFMSCLFALRFTMLIGFRCWCMFCFSVFLF